MMLDREGPRIAMVLGAAVWSGGRPSPTLARRASHAIDLWRSGEVDVILACGGAGAHPPSEAAVIGALCRSAGVPDAALRSEDRSTTTRENLTFALPILRDLAPSSIVIVTDPYHAPRTWLLARQLGIPATIRAPRAGLIGPRQWLKHVPREVVALVATLLRIR